MLRGGGRADADLDLFNGRSLAGRFGAVDILRAGLRRDGLPLLLQIGRQGDGYGELELLKRHLWLILIHGDAGLDQPQPQVLVGGQLFGVEAGNDHFGAVIVAATTQKVGSL